VVFVANATAGMKLIGECFREVEGGFWYGYHGDSHTSSLGLREIAREKRCFAGDEDVDSWIRGNTIVGDVKHEKGPVQLFEYPAQSNMNGRRLPLRWCAEIREKGRVGRGIYTLLDAASLLSTAALDLSDAYKAPDFTVLSFYKIFGFPDLGALIVRKASGDVLRHRRYFGGGTVEMVTCVREEWHIRKEGALHEQLEDGTLPVHSILALECALKNHQSFYGGFEKISAHTSYLAVQLCQGLRALRHSNGSPICEVYQHPDTSYSDVTTQGPIIAFNIRNSHGLWISNTEVEKLATIKHIHLRSGGLCNPGGIATSLGLSPWEMKRNFSAGQRCGNDNDVIAGKPTGVIRLSLGPMSVLDDVRIFLDFMTEFFVDSESDSQPTLALSPHVTDFYVETLMIYPIKSCAGWRVPFDSSWDIRPEGLAWDREWCLVHQGTRASLSQKRYPKMALLRPSLDFKEGLLRIRFAEALLPSCPSEITIPLSQDPTVFQQPALASSNSQVCGDKIQARVYASDSITHFFSTALGVPCYLARFPPLGSGPSSRHAKPHLQAQKARLCERGAASAQAAIPLLFSNESPILIISRSSLNHLNELIKSKSPAGKAASADVFRANIVVAEERPGIEQPYIEDFWKTVTIHDSTGAYGVGTFFDILGPCRRCQMVCVDQGTGERNEEPFGTLAKTRRKEGKVFFGMHAGLVGTSGRVRVGDKVKGREGSEERGG
jgi:molybdenum cofactor sulfurtransferase